MVRGIRALFPVVLILVIALFAGCATMDKPESAALYSYTTAPASKNMVADQGKGWDVSLPQGWTPMAGVADMKKGDTFPVPLDWLGISLGGKAKDTSGYSIWGIEFGNLKAVYRKPSPGGVVVLFSSWGGTRESLPAGIKRYLDEVVPDNKKTAGDFRIKPDKLFPLIQFYDCRAVKEGKPVSFKAILGWSWSFSRMYTFAAFYPSDEGAGAVSKAQKEQIVAEILDIAASMK